MKPFLKFAIARMSEGSSIRGAILLLSAVGITLRPELQDAIVAAALALAGLLGVVLPDAAPGGVTDMADKPSSLESEDYLLMESILRHFALSLHLEREKVVELTRQLECERERVALLESAATVARSCDAVLDLAFHRGLLSGRHYALALLKPGNMTPRPANPYWCPMRRIAFALGFSMGACEILYGR